MREQQDEIYIVMDFLDTDLHRVIQSDQDLTDAHFKHFMYQLLRGIHYMQQHGVLHRDLKPGNLLVTRHCDLMVGLAAAAGLVGRGWRWQGISDCNSRTRPLRRRRARVPPRRFPNPAHPTPCRRRRSRTSASRAWSRRRRRAR